MLDSNADGRPNTWTKEQIQELIDEYKGINALNLQATYRSELLWSARLEARHGVNTIVNKASTELTKAVTSNLDRISATRLVITEVLSKKKVDTHLDDWENAFLDMVCESDVDIVLIPDTNFIIRRYASGLERRLDGRDFPFLKFGIPNLVVLEIEAIYNRAKKKSENMHCPETERVSAFIEKNEALLATKELMFLRNRHNDVLEGDIHLTVGIPKNFHDIAGKGLTDMYIRKEVKDFAKDNGCQVRFLTCDLMNALSAVAEGLPTIYFSRTIAEKYWLSHDYQTCLEQLSELIINTATVFGETTLTAQATYGDSNEGEPRIKNFAGTWVDWTIEDLLNDRVIEKYSE